MTVARAGHRQFTVGNTVMSQEDVALRLASCVAAWGPMIVQPFLRPAAQPVTVMNHPPFVRMEQRSIPPLGSKVAKYRVPAELVKAPGKYRLAVRLRSRAEPIYFMRFVGATSDMERSMNEWMLDFHSYSVEFEVKP